MDWDRGIRRHPAQIGPGGLLELSKKDREMLQDEALDVRVEKAAVVGQERELSHIEKKFEEVSRTERAVMHDYRQKYTNEKRSQQMYEAELKDDDRLNLYQANLIKNFTNFKTKQASLSQIEARVRKQLGGSMVNLTSLMDDIRDLESINDTLNGPSSDDNRFDAVQAKLMVVGSSLTQQFNDNVYRVQDIKNRTDTVNKQLDKAEVILQEMVRKFVEKENRDSLAAMIAKNASQDQMAEVLSKLGISSTSQ